jgi:hypothetical protein
MHGKNGEGAFHEPPAWSSAFGFMAGVPVQEQHGACHASRRFQRHLENATLPVAVGGLTVGFTVFEFSSPETPPRKRDFHSLKLKARQVFNLLDELKGPGSARCQAKSLLKRLTAFERLPYCLRP